MKIIIAIDKFKGCASSQQLSQAINTAILKCLPEAQVITVPIADGGDGTLQCIKSILGSEAKTHHVSVPAPLPHLPMVDAEYVTLGDTAYMDLATASGLTLVPLEQRDIMTTSTIGTGKMISHAIKHSISSIVLGLGGSATCDGGIGILSALGFKFLDNDGNKLPPNPTSLSDISKIDSSDVDEKVMHTQFTLLSDVDNPLCGDNGAAHVFAPQKGASQQQVELLDNGLKHFATLLPPYIAHQPGAGAAGGVTAGMTAMLNATIKPGIYTLLELADFDNIISDADLIITGEGRIDKQTMHGKAPAGVLNVAQRQGIPVIALCGSIAPGTDTSKMGFKEVIAVTPPGIPLEQALDTTSTLNNITSAITSHLFSSRY